MPYIKKESRVELEDYFQVPITPKSKGELNYVITKLLHQYVLEHGINYQILSDAKEAAIGAAEEFARVVLGPYEDKKRRENGSISSLDFKGDGQDKW